MITTPPKEAPSFSCHYLCYARCLGEDDSVRYPITDVRFSCEHCGGLLTVEHDRAALAKRSGPSWWTLFAERAQKRIQTPFLQSGVWSKKEWVCPTIPDAHIVSLLEGNTPLLPVPALGAALLGTGASRDVDLWVKQCGQSHTGSFKDLGMTVLVSMVNHLVRSGRQIPAVACASTGDTSAALAAYAARAGLTSLVFLPAGKITDEQLTQPIANHAITVALSTDFDGCMRLVAQFCERHGVYLANSMNPLRMEGQKTLAVEICEALERKAPDVVVVPGGNLGNVTAIGRGFMLMKELGLIDKLPRLVVAQAAHAAPLYKAFKNGWLYEPVIATATQASAIQIGAPVNVHKAIDILRRFDGLVGVASEDELAQAAVLGDRHGLYADPHTGVALAVVGQLLRNREIDQAARVVVVSTAHGLKFSAMKRSYHLGEDRNGPRAEVRPLSENRPLVLPPEIGALEAALLPRIEASHASIPTAR